MTHVRFDGQPSDELNIYRYALQVLKQLYGSVRAAEFGPLSLTAVRQKMIEKVGVADTSISRLDGFASCSSGLLLRNWFYRVYIKP
jgi:hypothetical protein